MISKVRDFIDGFRSVLRFGCNDDFCTFLTDLFQNLIDAFFKQVCSIGAFWLVYFSAYQHFIQTVHGELIVCGVYIYKVIETGFCAQMAGRSFLHHFHRQSISVAVCYDGNDVLHIAAGIAFSPQFLSGTGPEAGSAFFHTDLQAFFVHISHSQHLFAVGIYNDSGDETPFVEFQVVYIKHKSYSFIIV